MTGIDDSGRFRGIYPMQYAFFGPDGALDRAAMGRQAEACIAKGAHGIAILGLGTEVSKLTEDERRQVLEWTAETVAGRVPLAVTVFGRTPQIQIDFVHAAQAAGADWVILQPPPIEGLSESDCQRFFGTVMEKSPLPVAIQNAPQYLGIGLSSESLRALRRNHANFTLLKGEGTALAVSQVIEETGGELAVFNGRAGVELPDVLRAGCVGIIPASESIDYQARIFDLMASGRPDDEAEAERLYQEILPMLVFLMDSMAPLLCYGKRIAARRLGLGPVHDRAPAMTPTSFGLACAERYAVALGDL
jgi:dihydrodipicolinate synthase/N-acetylneuraminate lyase